MNKDKKNSSNEKNKPNLPTGKHKNLVYRIGETLVMNCGEVATIIEYRNSQDITVEFKNCVDSEGNTIKKKTTYANFYQRKVSCEPQPEGFRKRGPRNDKDKKEREGDQKEMNNKEIATIKNYRTARDMDVQFDNGKIVKGVRYDDYLKGKLSSLHGYYE